MNKKDVLEANIKLRIKLFDIYADECKKTIINREHDNRKRFHYVSAKKGIK